MGIKTTVNEKGVVSEKVAGNDQLIVKVRSRKDLQAIAADAGATAGGDKIAVFEAASNAVTASLPALGDGNSGLRVHVVNLDTSNPVVLSGTNDINGGGWELELSGSGGYAHSAEVVAISSSAGFEWLTVSQEPS